jgi:predicted AAA+ superfamily ATPase
LEEEVKAEALVRSIGPFARFLELAAIESGRIVNFSSISKQIGPSVHTIKNYYEVLIDCLVAERIDPITRSATRKKLTQSPKILFFDMGVRRVAAREGTRLIPERMGELFEQWIRLEILRLFRGSANPVPLHFWRDPDGPEVDWVINREGEFIPIEVKWTDSPSISDAKHISTFMREYSNSSKGYVVCRAPRAQKLADRIRAIPWQDLESLKG